MRIFFETKSFRLFSLLFGFGIAVQMLRAEQRQVAFLPFYLRRLLVLFVIGVGHTLLYDGDVLMLYAEFGLILLVFRRAPTRVFLVAGAILSTILPVERVVTSLMEEPQNVAPIVAPLEVRVEAARERNRERLQSHPYAVGSIGDVMTVNARAIPPNPVNELSFLGMFLLGVYVGRRRILQDLEAHRPLIRRVRFWGLSVGLLGMSIERLLMLTVGYSPGVAPGTTAVQQFIGDTCHDLGSAALCLGYAAVIVLLAQDDRWKRFLSPLGAVGRLALTTYLVQTLMFTTLFYGYAFGQAFRIGPAAVTMYAVLFFAVQMAACSWWIRRFRFGPAEWLWRTLSYLQLQPMRIQPRS